VVAAMFPSHRRRGGLGKGRQPYACRRMGLAALARMSPMWAAMWALLSNFSVLCLHRVLRLQLYLSRQPPGAICAGVKREHSCAVRVRGGVGPSGAPWNCGGPPHSQRPPDSPKTVPQTVPFCSQDVPNRVICRAEPAPAGGSACAQNWGYRRVLLSEWRRRIGDGSC
jgi:hypothetical protein